MRHARLKELFRYWVTLKGNRVAPERGDLQPANIRHLLRDMFILETTDFDEPKIRLAGTRLGAWFGHDLKNLPYQCLWTMPAWKDALGVLNLSSHSSQPAHLKLQGRVGNGEMVKFEMLLLPLHHRGLSDLRMLGALVCEKDPEWLGSSYLTGLQLISFKLLNVSAPKPEKLKLQSHRPSVFELRPHWRVIEGSGGIH